MIPALERSRNVDLVAVHTRAASGLEEVARSTEATPYQDVDRMLAADDVDVIYVATPTGLHASMAMGVIEAGKHVWCEKPMTTSFEDAQHVIRSAVECGLVALESDMFLHHPQFVELQRLMLTETVGPAVSMTARFGFPHLSRSDFRYSKNLGGGALFDAGFYPVAATVALLGSDARIVGAAIIERDEDDVDIGGTALALAGERSAVLDWGFGRSYRNEIEVWCEGGLISTGRAFSKPSDLATEIVVRPQGNVEYNVSVEPTDQFSKMFDDFAAITRGETPFDPEPILARARLLSEIGASGRF